MTSWFSIQASIENVGGESNTNVNYYFSVDTNSNLVTGFYDYNNIGVDTLFPIPPSLPNFTTSFNPIPGLPYYSKADNFFDIATLLFADNTGVNYSDTYLQLQPIQYLATQTTPLTLNYPLFSFYGFDYGSGFKNYLWAYDGSGDVLTNSIIIQSISQPPIFPVPVPTPFPAPRPLISMGSLYTNNAQVFYKLNSLAPGGIGSVRNSRFKSRKT